MLGFAKVTRDLTEKRAAEEQLRQAQKMEAIGQLTGGIAHDFNNLLTVISGNLETLNVGFRIAADSGLYRFVNSAQHGASRAAHLTHQLLAFSRRQALEPKSVSVNALITHLSELLRRTLPESIAIEIVLTGGVWSTYVDANQLENSLLNLAVNARDAMPDGGKLTIEAANVYLDEEYAASADVPPGQYVGVFVSDTGGGMTPEIADKAFDPFFTTKEAGRGHRSRSFAGLWLRAAIRRSCEDLHRGRRRNDNQDLPATSALTRSRSRAATRTDRRSAWQWADRAPRRG